MSFDSEAQPKKLRSGSRSGSLRQIDKIEEDSEEGKSCCPLSILPLFPLRCRKF